MTDADAIRALLAARDAAIGAEDAEAAVATTETGAVTYDLAPPLACVHDRAAAVATLDDWLATWAGPITSELNKPDIIVSGDLAVAFGFTRLRGTSKSGGPHDSWFRTTVALARRPAGWRIVHEHMSYPTRMDGTGLSATDLQPA